MYKAICLLILLLGINCSDHGVGAPDLGMAAMDLGMAAADLGMTAADLSMAPMDLSLPGPPRLCNPNNWCWENPQPQGNYLYGVWGADANNVWAVGFGGTILRWNGTAWAAQTSALLPNRYARSAGRLSSHVTPPWAVAPVRAVTSTAVPCPP